MTLLRSQYGQMLRAHHGALPAIFDEYTDDQLKVMVNELIESWETLSVLSERSPTGLSIRFDRLEQWRDRPSKVVISDYPIERAARANLSVYIDPTIHPADCGIEWGDQHTRPVSQAPREALEAEVRALHNQLAHLKVVFNAQARLVGRILNGAVVSEESLYSWETEHAGIDNELTRDDIKPRTIRPRPL